MNEECTCSIADREELKRAYKILMGKSEWKPLERPDLYRTYIKIDLVIVCGAVDWL
jgi:hypothetical protein